VIGYLENLGVRLDRISTRDGGLLTLHTIRSFVSLVVVSLTSLPEDFYLCVAGVRLSSLTIKVMILRFEK